MRNVADEMRINARARRNHCERLLDAHNPKEAHAWRAAADALETWAVHVERAEAERNALSDALAAANRKIQEAS